MAPRAMRESEEEVCAVATQEVGATGMQQYLPCELGWEP